jgi:exopolysaccharide biosynthesis polyprenyl glycosylphosphotransferase
MLMPTTFHLKEAGRSKKALPPCPSPSDSWNGQTAGAGQDRRLASEHAIVAVAVLGDFALIIAGFVLAFWLRFESGLIPAYATGPTPALADLCKVILLGSAIVLWGFLHRDLYSYRYLLSPLKILKKVIASLSICLFVFIGITLTVRFYPAISRTFVGCSMFCILLCVIGWRIVLSLWLRHPAVVGLTRKRLVVVGAGGQTKQILDGLGQNPDIEFVGWVQAVRPNMIAELETFRLGPLYELKNVLRSHRADIVVLTEPESLQREGVLSVAKTCEMEHVEFKMVPHFFEILVSGLRPDVIGGLEVLGVESLPLTSYRSRAAKRALDIIGALVGLSVAIPLILLFGLLVIRESPGPVLYKQLRLGRNGRLFYIIKIRSMKINAETHGAQWARQNDDRRLRIGSFMRKWNIDEVPQFWNVLKGEMSLVGPRPERPELIERFKTRIPHYQARHTCQPGITGWAQVNGWRGNTDLEQRIRHDIWYVENWSLLLDLRIMVMTFFKRKNAY